jgi:tetratricopeptide (TPR) repeat protein
MEAPAHNEKPAADAAARRSLPMRIAAGAGRWTTASKLRMAITAVAGLLALAVVFATWSYVARMAVESLKPATIEMALAALEAGKLDPRKLEEAKDIVGEMQTQKATPELVGGAMYVLGVLKAREAELEASSERRVATHQIAARYLQQAIAEGVPRGREGEAAYLLGKSLVNGGQPEASIRHLEEALRTYAGAPGEVHALLVRALLESSSPNLASALAHNEFVIRDASLAGPARDDAWLLRAETLLRMGRPTESLAALAEVPGNGEFEGRRTLLLGRLELDAATKLPADSPEQRAKIDAAVKQFKVAEGLDTDNGALARQAIFWTAKCLELRGDRVGARAQYKRLSELYGDTEEGLAAGLAEADNARLAGATELAIAGYRSALQAVGNLQTYDNSLLPLEELRTRLLAAYQQFVGDELFAEALTMLDLIAPVVGRAECMELRAKTHQAWGARRRDQAAKERRQQAAALANEGRFHLRAAGLAYEDLARMRYATRYFTDDLWVAADCYFQGQSYSSAARLFQEFLANEARKWNDVALVRLGQSLIPLGKFQEAIDALEECIEIFPDNPVTHQARLEAGRAYQQIGEPDEAERLLRENLDAKALTTESTEWRDSLFALGELLYEQGRYDEAVSVLDHAVRKYPDDKATLLAKYMIARAYHNAAEALTKRLRDIDDNETELNRSRRAATGNLESAHATYLDVQQTITLSGTAEDDPLTKMLLRNCYMMQGSVLVELKRFEEARQAYQNVITLYQNDPVVLEGFLQVANCWRRLDEPAMARGNLERAKVVLDRFPADANFLASTNFDRQQWKLLLDEMSKW